MNENINLCEILKDCPEGTEFWHSVYGKVTFISIDNDSIFPISLKLCNEIGVCSLTEDGHYKKDVGDCLLWPSKKNHCWSKWKCPKPKKPKFDPKTLQPFDKILARGTDDGEWLALLFSHINTKGKAIIAGFVWSQIIPYNDDTKHLIGTSKNAPEYYRYWED